MTNTTQPIVVLHINGGVVNQVQSTIPLRVIVLDEDIEGADDDRTAEINGDEVYVIDQQLTEANPGSDGVNVQEVLDIAAQADNIE